MAQNPQIGRQAPVPRRLADVDRVPAQQVVGDLPAPSPSATTWAAAGRQRGAAYSPRQLSHPGVAGPAAPDVKIEVAGRVRTQGGVRRSR